METYVRTHLLPYDFSLTAEQEADLFAEVRTTLHGATDDELFSVVIRHMMEELVDIKVQPWREDNRLKSQQERVKEIRDAALDYVGTFLGVQASPSTLDQLRQRIGISDAQALEAELRKRIGEWIVGVEDDQLLQYDVFTVKDLVFAQLRSWC
ncbi:MAG TPA: hypothetical protein VE422_50540 [Terriglobia bacterium]|nr:hypothetical protein [Terriglobia bacterium]